MPNQNNPDLGQIYEQIEALLDFTQAHLLLQPRDRLVARHRLYLFLGLNGRPMPPTKDHAQIKFSPHPANIYDLTGSILEWAAEKKLCTSQSDYFLSALMGQIMPLSSAIEKQFYQKYAENPARATEFFYQLSQNSAYIRSDRLTQNLCWKSPTAFGTIEVTINLAKPEKDPKAIAAAAAQPDSGYPQCLLCAENEGYAGHPNWAPRFNHRIVQLQLAGEPFAFQYSPYLYYPQHSILLSLKHRPMTIDRKTFAQLFDFVRQFPHYMVGSNADLPIVGGSILSHHHFQAGCYEFPMFRAPAQPWSEELLPHPLKQGNRDIRAEILNWPLSCIRISDTDPETLIDCGEQILRAWRNYSDQSIGLLAQTNATHNTITPIVRRTKGGDYHFFLVLRNNQSNDQHPLGIFHPHEEIHHIKKENIGLIEVMGLAILPGRLKHEMQLMEAYLRKNSPPAPPMPTALKAHSKWLDDLQSASPPKNGLNEYLRHQIAQIFVEGLQHCRVLPDKESWQRFLRHCGFYS